MEPWRAMGAHSGNVEAQNGALEWRVYILDQCSLIRVTSMRSRIRIRINVKRWIWIRIDVKCGIRIPMKVMRIRNPGPYGTV